MPNHTTHAIKCSGCGQRIGRWGVGFFRFKKNAVTRTRCKACAALDRSSQPTTHTEGDQ